ncbi:hypothetical protein KEM48_007798 [Puccinia striiformis f. sp. tritici PST-130]|nr:hypothetical protein KEM48_007798 [Puccinia striiformis f. sp. tritici PST-130]
MSHFYFKIKRLDNLVTCHKGSPKDEPVIGIATDATQQLVIVALGQATFTFMILLPPLSGLLYLAECSNSILLQRNTGMLAINCSDHQIWILDTDTFKIIRQLRASPSQYWIWYVNFLFVRMRASLTDTPHFSKDNDGRPVAFAPLPTL